MNKFNSVSLLGYWSSILFASTGILYGLSMGILLSNYKIPKYSNFEQFLSLIDKKFINLYTFSQLFAFISTLLFMVVLCSIHASSQPSNRIYSIFSICFGLAFTILASLNYFIQFSIVRLSLNDGITQNLESFVQFNPRSFSNAINMLGWSLFLGLSTLFLGIMFKGKGLAMAIRISLYVTSLFCFIGFVGFIFENQYLLFIFQVGMTLGLTIGFIFIALAFRRSKNGNILINK
jgi:hypothetical protein